MSEVKLNLTGPEPQNPIIVLNGKAKEPLSNLRNFTITGNIAAVVDFLAARTKTVEPTTSHIEVNEEAGTITLLIDTNIPEAKSSVTASLYRPPYFENLGINGNKTYGLKDIQELLRTHRFLFVDRSEYEKVVASLMKFKAKVDTTIETERNTSNSSKRSLVDKLVDVEQISFKVKTPLYVGGDEKEFLVEVCCDVTDASARFWLESIDLIELERDERRIVLEKQVEELAKYPYAIIQK